MGASVVSESLIDRMCATQDGSCNGLQHYAALGGDMLGAEQVNLLPSERPQDVYEAVAVIVRELVKKDVEAGLPLAKAIDGKISRKVCVGGCVLSVWWVSVWC